MPRVTCPRCGEDEHLSGRPGTGDDLLLTCGRCETTWSRDTSPRCACCGSRDVEGIPTSTLQEAGRGDQWAPSGIRLVYYCWDCGANDVTSTAPQRGPQPPPGGSRDLRTPRRRN